MPYDDKRDKHNPAPFDFVPFSKYMPLLKETEEWEAVNNDNIFTGYIDYKLSILTPLHIVGSQEKTRDEEVLQSCFMKRYEKPVIPGSSIKGMMRGFLEALTNSWVSQATDEYKQVFEERAHAFNALSGNNPAIPERFHPAIKDKKIDLASFLFGMVLEGGQDDNAYPSRIIFEDIVLDEKDLDKDGVKLPDVPGKALMGGPKPRINNWWYFQPEAIKLKTFKHFQNTDFMGQTLWGRKFYYHQKPGHVFDWYNNPANWPHQTQSGSMVKNNFRSYPVETLKVGSAYSARIYFNNMPVILLSLFKLAMDPEGMAHKLGYGQAFGLGSVSLNIDRMVFVNDKGFDTEENEVNIDAKDLYHPWYHQYVDEDAVKWLKRILYYDESFVSNKDNVFTSPLFGPVIKRVAPGRQAGKVPILKPADFQKLVSWRDAQDAAKKAGASSTGGYITLNQVQAWDVADNLWHIKKPVHFRVYQKNSRLWSHIKNRA